MRLADSLLSLYLSRVGSNPTFTFMIAYQAVKIIGIERMGSKFNVVVHAELWGHPEETMLFAIDSEMLKKINASIV